jgi:hypothetical protein
MAALTQVGVDVVGINWGPLQSDAPDAAHAKYQVGS